MKKNKLTTYILMAAVAFIWGSIIYKIIDATRCDDDTVLPNTTKANSEPYNDYSIPKDTSHLLLGYKDPFGLTKQKDTTPIKVHQVHTSLAVTKPPQMNWSFIKYSGYVRNPISKKAIALLSINGRNVTLAEGESAENVKLIKNMRDSIKVSFNGKTKFI